jgi:hypothetical protein
MGGSSKQKTKGTTRTNQTTTQHTTPYTPASGGLANLAWHVGDAMEDSIAVPAYEGNFVALPGQAQQAVIPALNSSAALAGSLVDPALAAAQQALGPIQGMESFASYDPSGVQSVVQAAMQPYIRQLTEQILPGMQSSGIESGAYSNDRAFATMPGQALRDTGRMAAEVASGIGFQDFLSQQERMLQGEDVLTQRLSMYPELLDTAMRMSTGQADLLQDAAGYDTAMRQAEINNAIAMNDYAVSAPYAGLDRAAQLYGTFAPYGTTRGSMNGTQYVNQTTTTSQPMGQQLLQGAIGVGGMLAGMPPGGLGALFGGGGQVAGAALNPMLSSAFSGAGSSNPFTQSLMPAGWGLYS